MYLDPGSTCGSTCVSVLTSSDVWTGSTLLYRGSLPNYMFQMYGEYPHLTDDPHNNLRYTRCTGTHRYIRHRCACVITMIFHSSLSSSDMQFQQRGKTKVKKGTICPGTDVCWSLDSCRTWMKFFQVFPLFVHTIGSCVMSHWFARHVRLTDMCPLPRIRLSLWQKPASFGGSHYAFPHGTP